uniref:5'-Nucleotidase C-terminal domain-containing protein n=1 Tax=Phlebotomus papatasi TaxID=29031 RepID=A0A1B0GP29_PHLPP
MLGLLDDCWVLPSREVRSWGTLSSPEECVTVPSDNHIDIWTTILGNCNIHIQSRMGQDDDNIDPLTLEFGSFFPHSRSLIRELQPSSAGDILGKQVSFLLIVQASAYTKYLGDITVYFDEAGEVADYNGAPIYLGPEIQPDPVIQEELIPWKEVVDEAGLKVVGHSKIEITKQGCSNGECNSGNLITDAYVHSYVTRGPKPEKGWIHAALCVTNTGGIRSLPSTPGPLNYGDLVAIIPFENTLDSLELRGNHILDMLEFAASSTLTWLQVSGMKIVFNMTKPVGERVTSVDLLCNECDIPVYEPLEVDRMYRFIMPSFLAGGGDGFYVVSENKQNHVVGGIDIDAFEEYVAKMSPLVNPITGRITVVT